MTVVIESPFVMPLESGLMQMVFGAKEVGRRPTTGSSPDRTD